MKRVYESHDDHKITPAEGSARRPDGRPADLRNPLHYPVTAVCAECGRAVRCERYMFADWEHTGLPPHPSQYLTPARLAQWHQDIEELAAIREQGRRAAMGLGPRLRVVR